MKFEIEEVDFEAMLEESFKKASERTTIDTSNSVKYIICYYLAGFLKKRAIPKYFKSIDSIDYINQITEYIEKLNINTDYSKEFLEENNKNELLSKFKRR